RHLDFYLALAERARPELAGPKQGEWLAQLDLERENLLAVHAWCDDAQGGADSGLRLVHALRPYWPSRGPLHLGHRVTVEAVRRTGPKDRTETRARGLSDAGLICCFSGRYAEAQGYLTESLSIARALKLDAFVAGLLQPLGMACLGVGDLA